MKNQNEDPALVVAIGGEKAAECDTENIIPLSALAVPDQGEAMQRPEPGDKVQYTVEGEVKSIEGDNAVVEIEAINGQSVEKNDKAEQAEPDEAEGEDRGMADLRQMAQGTSL
jgi:hypothetical protein